MKRKKIIKETNETLQDIDLLFFKERIVFNAESSDSSSSLSCSNENIKKRK